MVRKAFRNSISNRAPIESHEFFVSNALELPFSICGRNVKLKSHAPQSAFGVDPCGLSLRRVAFADLEQLKVMVNHHLDELFDGCGGTPS